MSASDKAFIKAFAKMAPATEAPTESSATIPFVAPIAAPKSGPSMASASSGSSATTVAPRSELAQRLRNLQNLQDARPAPTVIENVYAAGSLYRMESPQPAELPAPHFAPPSNQGTRRTVRRFSSRMRGAEPALDETLEKPAGMPPAMVRRMHARGLLEQARRMTGPASPEADAIAPPIVTQEMEPVEVLPATVAKVAAPVAPVAPSVAPVAVPAAPVEVLPEPYPVDSSFVAQFVDFSTHSPAASSVVITEGYSMLAESEPIAEPTQVAPAATLAKKPLLDLPLLDLPMEEAELPSLATVAPPPAAAKAPVQAPVEESFPTPVSSMLHDAALAAGLSADEQESLFSSMSAESDPAERYYRIDSPEMAVSPPHHEALLRGAESTTIAAEEEQSRLQEAAAVKAADDAAAQIETARQAAELAAKDLKNKSKKTCVPLWEVDRFLWPETVQKLLKDDKSYFMQAGAKLVAAAKDGLKTLAITGSRRGEGRSTLAMCLARCAAQSGISVAIIDADFQRPNLAGQIGLEIAYGWQDAASGKIPLAEAAVKSIADRVTVLPLETSTAATPLSLADSNVTSIFRTAADTFDLVVIDLGPMAAGEEPLFPTGEASPFDAVIVLRDLRYATATESQAVARRLQASGVEAVGIAENYSTTEI